MSLFVHITTFLAPFVLQSNIADVARAGEQERLAACLEKTQSAPEEAYEDGLAWMAEANRPLARHCTAIALIELGKFAEGAARLEALANASDGGLIEQRAVYLAQSGNAWLLARKYEAAELTLTNAIRLAPTQNELYKDRARARLVLENWLGADEDLTQSLRLKANDVDALNMRARARLSLGDSSMAYQDVQIARELEPENIDTLVLRGEVREALRKSGELD